MGKISNYASALKAKLTDFFVIASDNNGVLETKKVTTEQIGDAVASDQVHSSLNTSDKSLIGGINEVNSNVGTLSSLTTTDKSSLVGAVNEVNKHLTYDLIATFMANNDTWNATVDGTLIVTATASTTTASYVYLNGLSRTLGSIVCPNGAGGYNYAFSVPCIKGQQYKLLMGGFTSATVLIVYGTTN